MAALTVWRVSDGRRGHDSQSSGLAAALARGGPCQVHELPAVPAARALAWWLSGRFPPGIALPDPDLILGAGHGTHATLLAARRARGGRTVVLMRPSLPGFLFDLCLVPEHDPAPLGGRVLRTRGPLNSLRDTGTHDPARGLVLVGGPSRHAAFDTDTLAEQVRAVLDAAPGAWTVSDSPRTPPAARERLAALPGARFVPWEHAPPGWVAGELAGCATAWITHDSVSMVFEALTAGVAVGLLTPGGLRPGRVRRAMDALAADESVCTFAGWQAGRRPRTAQPPLAEADRCAAQLRAWLEAGC